jgi:Asp-tRNA(Asn)/Glu-tRNA(Gln) amidotransferase A subunit family amidase
MTWFFAERGRRTSVVSYASAIAVTHQIGRELALFQGEFDVILSPTLAQVPVPLGALSLSSTDPRAFGAAVRQFSPYTNLYNATGQPSMSVPLHWSDAGLPVGVMFSARFGDEATLFRLAAQLEEAQPWARRVPRVDGW